MSPTYGRTVPRSLRAPLHQENADLEAAGYLTRTRTGRRTQYTVNHDSLFRHPAQEGHRVGPFLTLLAASENARTRELDDKR